MGSVVREPTVWIWSEQVARIGRAAACALRSMERRIGAHRVKHTDAGQSAHLFQLKSHLQGIDRDREWGCDAF
jgi:hypothetical protein